MDPLNSVSQLASTLPLEVDGENFVTSSNQSELIEEEQPRGIQPQAGKSKASIPSVKQFRSYRIRLPITGACLFAGLSLALLSPPRIEIDSSLNHLLIALGYVVLICGIAIRMWSIAYISNKKSVSLVSTGPYSLCRNPLYVGTLLIVISYLLVVQSLTLALFILPVLLLYVWGVIPAEEQVLRTIHPEAYGEYCLHVPRWWPRWNLAAFQRVPLKWNSSIRREAECAGWWIVLAFIIQAVCEFRMATWWEHPLNWM